MLALIAMVAMASLVAGCRDSSPEDRFAEAVCSATLARAHELLETLDDAQGARPAPGPDAKPALLALAVRGTEIGTDLRDELAAIAAPDTPAGREAAKYLGQFGSRPLATMAEAQRRVRSLPESLPLRQSVSSFDELELVLAQAFSDMTTAQFVIMEDIPSLRKSFEDADSCKELVALGSD